MRTIDTVLFDLDDTLHDDSSAYRTASRRVAEEIAAERGVSAREIANAYDGITNGFWSTLTTEHLARGIDDERERMWFEALSAAGAPDRALAQRAAAAYVRERADVLALSPGSLELLATLRGRGCKLGLVTNGFAATHHEKIDRLGLRDRMDAFFLADEVGMVKPDPAIFLHACAVLGSAPERTAMVGDRYERDVRGAQDVGMFTIFLDVRAIPIPLNARPPDATITAIGDVLGVLEPMLPAA